MRLVITECKRILGRGGVFVFLALVLLASLYHSRRNLERYNQYDEDGICVGWPETLSEAKRMSEGLYLDTACMMELKKDADTYGYLNGENINALISENYERKTLQELSKEDMEGFFEKRVETISENLTQDLKKNYTDQETERLMEKAQNLSELPAGYAEGWKTLSENMGNFVFLLLLLLSALLLPVFGRDSQVQMEELAHSAKFGKRKLDQSRIASAYLIVTALYWCGMAVYFIIVMAPFGFNGAGQPIQNDVRMFYSLYQITYFQQFLINLLIGYAALLFLTGLTLSVTIILKNSLAGASVIGAFCVMLLIFNQVYVYQVDHWFANFMTVKMTDFRHFYTGNEFYRILGVSVPCLNWSVMVSLVLSAVFLMIEILVLRKNRKKGDCR